MIICKKPYRFTNNGMGSLDFFLHVEQVFIDGFNNKLFPTGTLNIVCDGVFYPGRIFSLDLYNTVDDLKRVIRNVRSKQHSIPEIGELSLMRLNEKEMFFCSEIEDGVINLSFDSLSVYMVYSGQYERIFFGESISDLRTIKEKKLPKGTLEDLIMALPDFEPEVVAL